MADYFSSPVSNPPQAAVIPASVTLLDGVTIAVDATAGNFFKVTLAGNRTLSNPTGAVGGQDLVFDIKQDAVGSRTLAFDTKFSFTGFSSPVVNPAASSATMLVFKYDAESDLFRLVSSGASNNQNSSLVHAQVVVPDAATSVTVANPAGFVNSKPVFANISNVTTNPVAIAGAAASGGNLTVGLGGLDGGVSGDPGVSTAIIDVWQDKR